jgi:uncharacterized protein (TIGR00255 family)
MRHSMTGFASLQGSGAGFDWTWELRGVNGKGLDLRLRLPDWIEGLEAEVRKRTGTAVSRGNVQISLKLQAGEDSPALSLDPVQLRAALQALAAVESDAMAMGVTLAPSRAGDLLAIRGVLVSDTGEVDQKALLTAVLASFDEALAAFDAMRAAEGEKLGQVLHRQTEEIEALVRQASEAATVRAGAQVARLKTQLARVLDNTDGADEARIAQELALIAVKSDITEEIDRLHAHVAAARDLLATKGPIGRKLDFLMQEFNREANTLCSKSGDAALTQVGLALKTVIDQMREQVQNVE